MSADSVTSDHALLVLERVDEKCKPVWEGCSSEDQMALSQYFLPHNSPKPVLAPTRPRIVKWYCPFASQREFPTGHRYCINVYTGCDHRCVYCYAAGYEPTKPGVKKDFQTLLRKDMEDLRRYNVPPAPVHLSNSTDPFQPLEREYPHTKYALEQILAHRHRFTTVVLLTKNPLLAAQPDYLDLLKQLVRWPADHLRYGKFARQGWPGLVVEVSPAFWREEAARVYDPGAATVAQRIEGIGILHHAGIPLVLRIDPLLPRSPIQDKPPATLADFGLPEAQTIDDLEHLVVLAGEVKARHVVYSPAKIVLPRGRDLPKIL
ncbi:MAG: hypothetical protein FJ280_11585 [Planctomycetes bacterium]|nr:hypothetical protein [Planctomycetota bacterium]